MSIVMAPAPAAREVSPPGPGDARQGVPFALGPTIADLMSPECCPADRPS